MLCLCLQKTYTFSLKFVVMQITLGVINIRPSESFVFTRSLTTLISKIIRKDLRHFDIFSQICILIHLFCWKLKVIYFFIYGDILLGQRENCYIHSAWAGWYLASQMIRRNKCYFVTIITKKNHFQMPQRCIRFISLNPDASLI